ncbi:Protein SIX6OS1 [Galemys pyrenaicus]|uniref:Protein SIX6OS1 n=1 Tax=Galemys pyrenaicus TaxID=202257 RepID=A0A8J6DKN2_GALPY|nr:Protein SIX6OS1 [Galemys pyrenaicus]
MNDSLFVSLDRLLLEFGGYTMKYEQDISTKEDIIQRINKCCEDIKQSKMAINKIHESIKTTDEEIGHYCKHSEEIKDSCSNWKPTCDVFHKHEDYMQDQFAIYQEAIEKDKKTYHDYVCQYKDVLKQYQLKYSEAPLSHEYYEKKREHDEIQSRHIAKLYETKNLSETIEDKTKNTEKRKELKKRIFEKDEIGLMLNKTPQDKQIFNDSSVNNHSKGSAIKSSQDFLQFRLLTPQKQSACNWWPEKEDTDAECGDKGTVIQLRESKCPSHVIYTENLGKSKENNSNEVEERTENFTQISEIPMFLRTPEPVKAPESLEKLLFPKSPSFEINRNTIPEGQTQKESPGFSFLSSLKSRSPGLNLFDSSVFDSEMSSYQFNEHYSSGNLNPLSSQHETGNLFGKPEREEDFTFSFPSDSSTGKDDFSFTFSFDQNQSTAPSSIKGFSSSQNTTQFTFF